MAGKKSSKTKADAEKAAATDADTIKSAEAVVEDSLTDSAETVEDIIANDVVAGDFETIEEIAEASVDEVDEPILEDTADDTDAEDTDITESEPDPTPDRQPVHTETIVERQGGFAPMILGGVVAAALGFGAAYIALPQSTGDTTELEQSFTAQIAEQSEQIASLSDQVEGLPAPADVSGLESGQTEIAATVEALSARIDDVDGRLGEMETRLTNVEKRPITEGASDAAVAAYERELKAVQDAMAAQRAEIEGMIADAQSMEATAEVAAQATMRRAAMTRIQTALEAGTGFAPALADLQATGLEVPAALANAAEVGTPSLATLQSEFPAVARAALAASRQVATDDGEGGGFSSFLKSQLGARSLEPREGNDPDAVLSRAEAAAREGRLTDALAEIEALPEEGRAEITEWAAKVTERLEVVAAAEALGQELN